VKRYWMNRGLLEVGHRVTEEALARPGAQARDVERARGLNNAGQLAYLMGRYGDARMRLEESLAVSRELGDEAPIASVLQVLGMAAQGEGALGRAREYLEEALALAQRGGDKRRVAAAMNALAQLESAAGRLDAAEPLFEGVVALSDEAGDHEVVAIGLVNLAMVAITRNAADRARALLLRAFETAAGLDSSRIEQSLVEASAGLATLGREWDRAARFYGAAEAQAAITGLRRNPTDEAFLAPLIESTRHALGPAAFADATSVGSTTAFAAVMDDARGWLLSNPA
jgi:tetratricopeptide (TPR) repeat protein